MTYHEIFNILIFNRKKLLSITIVSMIFIFLILLFVYPVSYRADVTILPPENDNRVGGIESILGGHDYSYLLMGNNQNSNPQLFAEILKSRTAGEEVAKRFDLVKYYGVKNIFEAVKKLDQNLSINISKERITSLSVNVSTSWFPVFFADKDSVKRLAADLSNGFVQALDKINREKLSSKARRIRIFLGSQIKNTKATLDSVENKLMDFQQKNKAVSLPDQLKAAITEAADLKSEIMKTEINIGMTENNLTGSNKGLLALKDKLSQLKDQYSKLQTGSEDYLMAFKNVPEVGKKLANLLREVKIQNEVYLMLQQQYYKEKIQENRNIPTIQVLDPAIPPLKSSGPRVILSTLLGGMFVFLLIVLEIIFKNRKVYLFTKKEGGD